MKKNIAELIKKYADVYKDFEALQEGENSVLPTGDQKTGVIAEYYAKCYLEEVLKVKPSYAKPGDTHDLFYMQKKDKIRIQVKAVSSHSKTRTIAPLKLFTNEKESCFDLLFLIALDEDFLPNGFFINSFEEIETRIRKNDPERKRKRIQGAQMIGVRQDGRHTKGSKFFNFSDNKFKDLLAAIEK